jgi:hypothetical protein
VAWIVGPVEATDANGVGVGRWVLTFSCNTATLRVGPKNLCVCCGLHGSPEEAESCPTARENARAFLAE